MQASVTKSLAFSSDELTACFHGPLSSCESISVTTQEEYKQQSAPFLREVEAMVDHAIKALEVQITDCVEALISDLPTAEFASVACCAQPGGCGYLQLRSNRYRGIEK